jgi:hypothetical protein
LNQNYALKDETAVGNLDVTDQNYYRHAVEIKKKK